MTRTIRVPERTDMTVCIAAVAQAHLDDAAIILCADKMLSGSLGSAQTAFKHHFLQGDFVVAVAWSNEAHKQLVVQKLRTQFSSHKAKQGAFDETTIGPLIQSALRDWKTDMAEEITAAEWGMTYANFGIAGKAMLPDDIYYQTLYRIKNCEPEVSFIVSGFTAKTLPVIWEYSHGRLRSCDDLAAVGSGEYLASASLMQREYSDVKTIDKVTGIVFEAKKRAEAERHVGSETTLCIQRPTEKRYVSDKGMQVLQKAYDELNAKTPPPPHIAISDYLTEDPDDEATGA